MKLGRILYSVLYCVYIEQENNSTVHNEETKHGLYLMWKVHAHSEIWIETHVGKHVEQQTNPQWKRNLYVCMRASEASFHSKTYRHCNNIIVPIKKRLKWAGSKTHLREPSASRTGEKMLDQTGVFVWCSHLSCWIFSSQQWTLLSNLRESPWQTLLL